MLTKEDKIIDKKCLGIKKYGVKRLRNFETRNEASVVLSRGGFRHVQHVRLNRAPTKRGPHKRTGKFLQHSNMPEIIIRRRFCVARWRHKMSSQVLPAGN